MAAPAVATVISAAANGMVACQAADAPTKMVWDRGPEAATATDCDVPARGAPNNVGNGPGALGRRAVEMLVATGAGPPDRGISWSNFSECPSAPVGSGRFHRSKRDQKTGMPPTSAPVLRNVLLSDARAR